MRSVLKEVVLKHMSGTLGEVLWPLKSLVSLRGHMPCNSRKWIHNERNQESVIDASVERQTAEVHQ